MFDTVKFGINITLSEQELALPHWTQTNSSCDIERNGTKTIYMKIHDRSKKGSPYIRYTFKEDEPDNCWLKVEVSIPTFMYGSNVYELKQNDIPLFFKKVRMHIANKLKLRVSRIPDARSWTVEKVHVSKSFQVGDKVDHYLNVMAQATIPQYKIKVHCKKGSNVVETVEWKATKRKEKLYNKEAEVLQSENYPGKEVHLKLSIGLLRYEIEMSDDEIRQLSPIRSAVKILKINNAVEILQRGLRRNGLSDGIQYLSFVEVINKINKTSSININTNEGLVAFATEIHLFGITKCKSKYAESTFRKRRTLLRTTLGTREMLIGDVKLPPLNVAKKQKKIVPVLPKQETTTGNKS